MLSPPGWPRVSIALTDSAERFHRRRNGPTAQHKEGKMDEVEQADELGRRIISRAARVYDEKLMT
jgi:hypothetical protein